MRTRTPLGWVAAGLAALILLVASLFWALLTPGPVERADAEPIEPSSTPSTARTSEAPPAESAPPDASIVVRQPAPRRAARAIERAGLGHERICDVGVGVADLDALSAFLPAQPLPDGGVAVMRRAPTGHTVLQTASGPVELAWDGEGCTAEAAATGEVTGRVEGPDGEPLEGATVEVCGAWTTTDADGRYRVEATVDGSAPLDADHAWCPLRASHPDHGASTARTVDLYTGVAETLTVEHPTDPQAMQEQGALLEQQRQAVLDGELDPDFVQAAEDAEQLEVLAQDPSLDAGTREALVEAARALIEGVDQNETLLDALEREPGR